MGKPVDITDADSFQQQVLEATEPAVLVDFWSHTCPHCTRLNPEYEAAAEADGSGVKFAKVAAQDHMEVFREFGVSGVPTLILFKAGQAETRTSGYKTSEEIAAWLAENV